MGKGSSWAFEALRSPQATWGNDERLDPFMTDDPWSQPQPSWQWMKDKWANCPACGWSGSSAEARHGCPKCHHAALEYTSAPGPASAIDHYDLQDVPADQVGTALGSWRLAQDDDDLVNELMGALPPDRPEQPPRERPTTQERFDNLLGYGPDTHNVEQVPVAALTPYLEFDRRPGAPLTAQGEQQAADPEYWQTLRDHIAQHGMVSPINLEYDPDSGLAYVGEGNHRLQIAQELGHTHVPVRVNRRIIKPEHHSAKPLSEPGQYVTDPYGHFPSSIKPSEVGLPTKQAKAFWRFADTPGMRVQQGQCSNCGRIAAVEPQQDGRMLCANCLGPMPVPTIDQRAQWMNRLLEVQRQERSNGPWFAHTAQHEIGDWKTGHEPLKQVAREIEHCGDYGQLYWNPKSKTVWWVAGDADGPPEYTDRDDIVRMFSDVSGVEHVYVEAEAYPPDDESWERIDYDDEPEQQNVEPEPHPPIEPDMLPGSVHITAWTFGRPMVQDYRQQGGSLDGSAILFDHHSGNLFVGDEGMPHGKLMSLAMRDYPDLYASRKTLGQGRLTRNSLDWIGHDPDPEVHAQIANAVNGYATQQGDPFQAATEPAPTVWDFGDFQVQGAYDDDDLGYWMVEHSPMRPEDSVHSDQRDMYTHSPYIADPDQQTVYVGAPGTHHPDLWKMHGLTGTRPWGVVNPSTKTISSGEADTPSQERAIVRALRNQLGLGSDWREELSYNPDSGEEQWHFPSFESHTFKRAEDYWMHHRPQSPGEVGAPLHDLEQAAPDIYEHPEYYGTGDDDYDRESFGAALPVRGNPNASVTIHRSAPVNQFNTGDWVSLSHGYAKLNGMHADDPSQDMPVWSARVPANTLWWDGDSINEFGYHGPPIEGQKFYRTRSNPELRPGSEILSSRTADVEGYTNWETFNVAVTIANDRPLYEKSHQLVREGASPEQYAEWATRVMIAPHNQATMQDAQAWNAIPQEERLDPTYEAFKDKHGDNPEAMNMIHNIMGGPDVSDTMPNIIDPQKVNWTEIISELREEEGLPTLQTPDTFPSEWTSATMPRMSAWHFGSKMDWLRKRPDLQSPEAQQFLNALDKHYNADRNDGLMPWLTREWKRGRLRAYPDDDDYEHKLRYDTPHEDDVPLHASTVNHWSDWYHSDHPTRQGVDIGSKNFQIPQMQEKIRDWEQAMKEEAERTKLQQQEDAPTLHEWPDGWKLKQLGPEHLDYEGDAMGHCVGGYGYEDRVRNGQTMITSLRDPQGKPHVTGEFEPTMYERQDGSLTPEWMEGDEGPFEPSFHNAHIVQIQGRGNEVPKPEYQRRMKDWFTTFPEETRPNWHYDNVINHIGQITGNPDRMENDEGIGGGYGPHGDYGLAEPKLPTDYDDVIESLRQRSPWRGGYSNPYYELDEVRALYDHARKRGEIPDLARATENYHQNTALPAFDDHLENNLDYYTQYPGESWDEEPERWGEPDSQYEYGEDDREPQERFQDAREAYDEGQREAMDNVPEMGIANDLFGYLKPHYNPKSGAYENALLPGTFSRAQEPSGGLPDPRPVNMASWAFKAPTTSWRFATQTASEPWHYQPMTGRPCFCPWGRRSVSHTAAIHTAGQHYNKLLKAPDKRLNTPEGERFKELLGQQLERVPEADPLSPWLANRFKRGDIKHAASSDDSVLGYNPWDNSSPYRDDPESSPLRDDQLRNWSDWYNARQHPTRRGVNVMDPDFGVPQMRSRVAEHQQSLAEQKLLDEGLNHPSNQISKRWPDGWHVAQLGSREAMEAEGQAMNHCIGDSGQPYLDLAENGDISAYSLRDPRGWPHGTWHTNNNQGGIAEVFGHSDRTLNPEHQQRYEEWAHENGHDPHPVGNQEEANQYDTEIGLPAADDARSYLALHGDSGDWSEYIPEDANPDEYTEYNRQDPDLNGVADSLYRRESGGYGHIPEREREPGQPWWGPYTPERTRQEVFNTAGDAGHLQDLHHYMTEYPVTNEDEDENEVRRHWMQMARQWNEDPEQPAPYGTPSHLPIPPQFEPQHDWQFPEPWTWQQEQSPPPYVPRQPQLFSSWSNQPIEHESKTAMAERSGIPELDRAIDEFMQSEFKSLETTVTDLNEYREPHNAHGQCEVVANALAEFLKERGFKAYATSDELSAFPGYEDAQLNEESYPDHAMVEVYGLPGMGVNTVTIDFTASQYGFVEFPKIEGGKLSKTAALTGDPKLDQLLEQYRQQFWNGATAVSPEEVEGMCTENAHELAEFLKENGVEASVRYVDYPSELGYTDRTRVPEPDEGHAVVVTGRHTIDFSAAQYGYSQFPMILIDGQRQSKTFKRAAQTIYRGMTLPNRFSSPADVIAHLQNNGLGRHWTHSQYVAEGYGTPMNRGENVQTGKYTVTPEDIANSTDPIVQGFGEPGTYPTYEWKQTPRNHIGVVLHGNRDPSAELEWGGQRNRELDPGWGAVPWGEAEIALDPNAQMNVHRVSLLMPDSDDWQHHDVNFTAPTSGSRLAFNKQAAPQRSWHLTDDPNFQLDPEFAPQLNSLAGDLIENPAKGLFVAQDAEPWFNGYDYKRPYVAEIQHPPLSTPGSNHYGDFLPAEMFPQSQVSRVLPWDEYCRETYNEPGHVEEFENPQSWDQPRRRYPNYQGVPTSQMTPEQLGQWEARFHNYLKQQYPHLVDEDLAHPDDLRESSWSFKQAERGALPQTGWDKQCPNCGHQPLTGEVGLGEIGVCPACGFSIPDEGASIEDAALVPDQHPHHWQDEPTLISPYLGEPGPAGKLRNFGPPRQGAASQPLDWLAEQHPNVEWYPHETDSEISTGGLIRANPPGEGHGTRAMQALCDYADQVQKPIVIAPTNEFGTPLNALKQWYGGLGFVPITNRNRNYALSRGTMMRTPQDQHMSRQSTTRSLYHGTLIDHLPSIQQHGLIPDVGSFVSDAYDVAPEGQAPVSGQYGYEDMDPAVYLADKQGLNRSLNAMRHHIGEKLGLDFHDVTEQHLRNHGLLVKYPSVQGTNQTLPQQTEEEYGYGDDAPRAAEPGDYWDNVGISPDQLQFIHGPALMRVLDRQGLLPLGNPRGPAPPRPQPPSPQMSWDLSVPERPEIDQPAYTHGQPWTFSKTAARPYYRWLPTAIRDDVQQSGMSPNPATGNPMHFWDNLENAQRYGEIANLVEPHDLWQVQGRPGRLKLDPWFKSMPYMYPEYGSRPGAWQSDAEHIEPERLQLWPNPSEDNQ